MFGCLGAHDASVAQQQVGASEMVARQSQRAHQPADAAAEGEPGNPGVTDRAARHHSAGTRQRAIYIAEARAWLNSADAGLRAVVHLSEAREIEDYAPISAAATAYMMTTAPQRERDRAVRADVDDLT